MDTALHALPGVTEEDTKIYNLFSINKKDFGWMGG
jgi:hypothetical protein